MCKKFGNVQETEQNEGKQTYSSGTLDKTFDEG